MAAECAESCGLCPGDADRTPPTNPKGITTTVPDFHLADADVSNFAASAASQDNALGSSPSSTSSSSSGAAVGAIVGTLCVMMVIVGLFAVQRVRKASPNDGGGDKELGSPGLVAAGKVPVAQADTFEEAPAEEVHMRYAASVTRGNPMYRASIVSGATLTVSNTDNAV